MNRDKAATLANLLEDLNFPATKADIQNHVNKKQSSESKKEGMVEAVNNLKDGVSYNSVYEIELINT